jgi:hypothetical protein
MAVEPQRACGYRKIGGIYLEGGKGIGFVCGRLPLPVHACQSCGQQVKFTRALQRITAAAITVPADQVAGGWHSCSHPEAPMHCAACPLALTDRETTLGLLWIGSRYYTPETFTREATVLGVSRRLPFVPGWVKPGETWILVAHREACLVDCTCSHFTPLGGPDIDCQACKGSGKVGTPGVFYAFRAHRIVKIVPNTITTSEYDKLAKRGLVPVMVPENDPDHFAGPADDWKDQDQGELGIDSPGGEA